MKERKLAHQNRIWLANGPHVNFVVFAPGDQHSGRLLPNFQTIYIWCMCHKLLCKTLPSQGEHHHHHLSYCVAATQYKSYISWNPNMHKPYQKPKKNAQHSSLEDTQLISSLHLAKLFDRNFSFLLSFSLSFRLLYQTTTRSCSLIPNVIEALALPNSTAFPKKKKKTKKTITSYYHQKTRN